MIMAKITFYPLGNADSYLIQTDQDKFFLFDFAEMKNPEDASDKRMPLEKNLKDDINWPSRRSIDVLAISHGDNDHVKGISDTFWLEHAKKYQGDNRIRIKELWVPAALIVEVGSDDDTRVIRQEARHRFLENKNGIKVFARPEHLKNWLEKEGKEFDDYRHLICDAGKNVPGWSIKDNGVEFFVHAPFAEKTDDGSLERNDNSIVMQVSIDSEENITRLLATGDSVKEQWDKIVQITRYYKRDEKLGWDIFKIPHHCSYKAMSAEKGSLITEPTEEFQWLLDQGAKHGILVSTSKEIPATTTTLPPHVETYRRYQETKKQLDGDLAVTMEHPDKRNPQRLIIQIDGDGATLLKHSISKPSVITTSQRAPRAG
jgi:ribonuclease BN (tRNA processing enzyme)